MDVKSDEVVPVVKTKEVPVAVTKEEPKTETPVLKEESKTETPVMKEEIKTETPVTELTKNGAVATENQNGSTQVVKEEVKPTVKSVVKLTPELAAKVVKQIEYYFGNYNLPRDKFLVEEVKKDDGWVSLHTMCTFKRLASITTNLDSIVTALKKATIIEVNETDLKIRRSPAHPLPDFGDDINTEVVKRTIYLKGCKKDGSVTLDALLEYFKQYGTYEAIKMRKYNAGPQFKQSQGFKGSILVIYPTVEAAKKLMENDEIIFQNAPLLRKWYADYLTEKKKEIEDRRAEKAARHAKRDSQVVEDTTVEEKDPEPTGTYLHLSGLPNTTSREDIKETLAKHDIEIAFVGMKRGDAEGYIRLSTPFTNLDAVATLKGKVEFGKTEATVRAVVGSEEIDQLKDARKARSNMVTNSFKRKRDGGGYGGFRGGRGGHAKKRKH